MLPLGCEQDCQPLPSSEPATHPCRCSVTHTWLHQRQTYHLNIRVGLPCKQKLRIAGIDHLSSLVTFDEVEPGSISHITVSPQACLWSSILWVVKPATPGTSLATCVVMFLHSQDQFTEYIITGVLRGDSSGDVLVNEVWGSAQAFYSLQIWCIFYPPQ